MTLQRAVSVATVLVLTIALVSAGALVGITTLLHRSTQRLAATLQSVRAAEELQADLARSNRASVLLALTGEPRYAAERADAERGVRAGLEITRLLVAGEREARAFDTVQDALARYHRARAQQDASGLQAMDGYRAIQPALDSATMAIDRFVDENYRQALGAQRRSEQWDALSDALGVSVAALLAVVLAGLMVALRRRVVRPLLGLRDVVQRLGAGERDARASLAGVPEVREIATALNEATDALERQRGLQLQFLAGVAHDLRNPIAALKLSAEAARPRPGTDAEAQLAQLRALVARQGERLNRMVGDLLDATRIEAGRLELSQDPCDLRDIVRATAALFERASPAHPVRVTLPDEPLRVRCDAARIEQVLNNLLSNAIKYSPEGGEVVCEATRHGDDVVIRVRDRGIGVAAEDLARIFEPFRRTATTRSSIPGVGLGLSVARRIVQAHGGRLEVESEPGQGSTFLVRLAAMPADASVSPVASSDSAAREPPRLEPVPGAGGHS